VCGHKHKVRLQYHSMPWDQDCRLDRSHAGSWNTLRSGIMLRCLQDAGRASAEVCALLRAAACAWPAAMRCRCAACAAMTCSLVSHAA
jgi:hypothetical protein